MQLHTVRTTVVLSSTVSAALLAAVISPAAAVARETANPNGSCVVSVDPRLKKETRCFDNLRDATAYATDGRYSDAPDDLSTPERREQYEQGINDANRKAGAENQKSGGFTASSTTAVTSLTIGTLFKDLNQSGLSFTVTAAGNCDDSVASYQYSLDLTSLTWSDSTNVTNSVSSFLVWGADHEQCWEQHFNSSTFTGIMNCPDTEKYGTSGQYCDSSLHMGTHATDGTTFDNDSSSIKFS
jgi:hypothetical protein